MTKKFVFTGSEVVQEFETEPVSGCVVAGKVRLVSRPTVTKFYSPGGEFEQIKAKQGTEYAEATFVARNIVSWNIEDTEGKIVAPTPEIVTLLPERVYNQLVAFILGTYSDPFKKKSEPSSN